MRAGKTEGLKRKVRRWGSGKTPIRYIYIYTETYMMSEGRKVGWDGLEKIEEDRVVEIVLMMKG